MSEHPRSLIGKLIQDLVQQRDELKLDLHLGTQEAKEQWEKLEDKLFQLRQRFQPAQEAAEDSAEQVWDALKLLAGEVKDGFDRVRKSL
jgi:hypothetical protein